LAPIRAAQQIATQAGSLYCPGMIRYRPIAEGQMQDRRIERIWIEAAVTAPDWTEADPNSPAEPGHTRLFQPFGGRILRVASVRG
jgi:hypothetical protein